MNEEFLPEQSNFGLCKRLQKKSGVTSNSTKTQIHH